MLVLIGFGDSALLSGENKTVAIYSHTASLLVRRELLLFQDVVWISNGLLFQFALTLHRVLRRNHTSLY